MNTLGSASKVSVNNQTIQQAGNISAKQKRELQKQKVLELIENTPAGKTITTAEFARVMGLKPKSVSAAYTFINQLVKEGVISRYNTEPFKVRNKWAYSIVQDQPEAKDEANNNLNTLVKTFKQTAVGTTKELDAFAMWANGEISDNEAHKMVRQNRQNINALAVANSQDNKDTERTVERLRDLQAVLNGGDAELKLKQVVNILCDHLGEEV